MPYRWKEIDQLAEILEDEIAGRPVDTARARALAERLTTLCPDIAGTMRMQIDRLLGHAMAA